MKRLIIEISATDKFCFSRETGEQCHGLAVSGCVHVCNIFTEPSVSKKVSTRKSRIQRDGRGNFLRLPKCTEREVPE